MAVDLRNGKIFPLLLKLGLPAMLAQFVNVLYAVADRIFIGNIPVIGDIALAGAGVSAPLLTLISSFAFLVGLGGAPLLAMKMGAGRNDDAKKIMANSFVMLTVLSVVITVVFIALHKPLLTAFGASEKSFEYAKNYFIIYVGGTIFALLTLGLNSFITAQGHSFAAMFTVIIGAVLNLLLDPLFIFVFNMGVKGAAIATVISQAVSAAFVIGFLLSKKPAIRLSLKGLSAKIMGKIMLLGVSPFLIIATDSLVLILLNTRLARYGGADADALITSATIILSFMQLVTLPMGGITMGCQPVISYNYGAGDYRRVKKAFASLTLLCVIFTCVMFVFAMILPSVFARIFSSNEKIIEISAWGIRVQASGIIMLAIQYACVDGITALTQAGKAITLSLTRKLIIMTTLLFVLPAVFGARAAFIAQPISDAAAAVISGSVCLFTLSRPPFAAKKTKINKFKGNREI